MIAIPIKLIESFISSNNAEIEQAILLRKGLVTQLMSDTTISLDGSEKEYLTYLVKAYEQIVKAKPEELQAYANEFNKIIPNEKIRKDFKDRLIVQMGYTELRRDLYPLLFAEVGIKSCVYCNSQLAVTTENDNNKTRAKFQVDHRLPQANFPCFSTSFYNLYPVCGICNLSKGKKIIEFGLYSSNDVDLNKSKFLFKLEEKSLSKYLTNGKMEVLEVVFSEPDNTKFNEIFDIKGIYQTQLDIAEELVLKSQIYTEIYKDGLRSSFGTIFNKADLSNRIIIGNYDKGNEIHKRPLSKFTQDISRQLGLIK